MHIAYPSKHALRAVLFACVCAIANHQVCFRGVQLTETVEVTRVFHAVTLKG